MKPDLFLKTLIALTLAVTGAAAQTVLFDFDNAPLHTSLPIEQTAGGITAHIAATGQGFSIQEANTMGFTPAGLAGRVIYPNSINLADLLIRFDHTLIDFSILYSCQELGCDDAATMRVTAYRNGSLVGTNTKTASHPGTWPVDTLACAFPQGFDSIVVHYDRRPPTCQDYGTIFLADNMRVTAQIGASVALGPSPNRFDLGQNYPNPFNPVTTIRYTLPQRSRVALSVFDMLGQKVAELVNGAVDAGLHEVQFNAGGLSSGVYFYRLQAGSSIDTKRLLVVR